MENRTNILILLVSTLLALVAAEVATRFYLFGTKGFTYVWVDSFQTFAASDLWQKSALEGLDYELKPNLNQKHKLTVVNTNSLGMNDREYPVVKPESNTRVAVLGDSFSFATGVEASENYHALAEEKLKSTEVLNFSVPGYNLHNYSSVLSHKVLPLQCSHVVVGFCPYNDFSFDEYSFSGKTDRIRTAFWQSFLVGLIKHTYHKFQTSVYRAPNEQEMEYATETLRKMKSTCEKNGIGLSVFVVSYEHMAAIDSISAVCGRLNIPIGFSHTAFDTENLSNYWLCPLDQHPNTLAHQKIQQPFLYHLEIVLN